LYYFLVKYSVVYVFLKIWLKSSNSSLLFLSGVGMGTKNLSHLNPDKFSLLSSVIPGQIYEKRLKLGRECSFNVIFI